MGWGGEKGGVVRVQTELERVIEGWRNGGGRAPLGVVVLEKSRPCEGLHVGGGGWWLGGGKVATWGSLGGWRRAAELGNKKAWGAVLGLEPRSFLHLT